MCCSGHLLVRVQLFVFADFSLDATWTTTLVKAEVRSRQLRKASMESPHSMPSNLRVSAALTA